MRESDLCIILYNESINIWHSLLQSFLGKKSHPTYNHVPLCLAFFTGFSSMQSNDLFLLGTPFKKLRPWIVGWAWPPFWVMPFRKAPFWDWHMFCWKFWALERISAHSRNPWAWARSAADSPLAFLTLHNRRTSVRHAQCTLRVTQTIKKQNTAKHAHTYGLFKQALAHMDRHTDVQKYPVLLYSVTTSSSSSWKMTTDPWGSFASSTELSYWQFPNG